MKRETQKGTVLFWILSIALTAWCLPVCSAADAGSSDPLRAHVASLEENPFVTRAVFKNGMKVLINQHRAQPVVSIQIHVNAGYMEEPDAYPGMASLVARMFFRRGKESETGTPQQKARMLGAFLSSSVDYGHSVFEIQGPASQWEKALQAVSEAVSDTTYDPDQVKTEAALLGDEAIRRLEAPTEAGRESLFQLGFGSAVPGRWTSVLKGNPGMVPAEALSAFHKRMFVPGRILLVVAGDINAIEVLTEAARLLGELAPGTGVPPPEAPIAFQASFRYRQMQGRLRNPLVFLGFRVPGPGSADYPALEVLNAILGLGNGSILTARMQNQKKVVYRAESELASAPGSGYAVLHASVPPEGIDRSEIAMFVELELLKRKAPERADMERARAQLERAYRDDVQTVSGRARMLAQFEMAGDYKEIDRHISEIRKVQAADVRRVAEKYFKIERCSLLEYLPDTEGSSRRTRDSIRSTLASLLAPATDQEQALREKEIRLPLEIPEAGNNFKFSWIQYPFITASLLRGPEIYIREDHTTPLIHLGLFFPGGVLQESAENSGITSLMASLMLRGTQKKDAYQFNRQLEVYGGRIQPVVAEDYFGFYFSIPSKNFKSGFSLLTEAIQSPAFDAEAVDWQKAVAEADRLRYKDDRDSVREMLRAKLFGDFPYSRDPLGTQKSTADISPDSLRAWHGLHVKNRKPFVVIVGDTVGTSLSSYFVQHFSGSRFQQTELPEEFVRVPEKKENLQINWERSWSLVSLGFQAPPFADRDRPAILALLHYLKTGASTVAKDRDFAENIHLIYEPLLRGGGFIAYAVVDPGSEGSAFEELEQQLQKSATSSYLYRGYRAAVNSAVGYFQLSQQRPFSQITDVALNVLAAEGIEGYRSFQGKLLAVQEEDMRSAAERIFKMERAVSLHIYGVEPEENSTVPEKQAAMEN